jgi:hypothetical protein
MAALGFVHARLLRARHTAAAHAAPPLRESSPSSAPR